MDRFVAMIWDEADPSKQPLVNSWGETLQHRSSRWTIVLDTPGLRVLSLIQRGDAPVVTIWHGEDGIIVGPLFARGQEKGGRVRSLDRHEAERVVATRGDCLIKDYWGNYVALWRDAASRRTIVLRDPCGAVPCLMTKFHGVEVFFSHADDVATLPGLHFTTDWNYLQAFILFNYFVTKYTGLNEVTELLAGERLEWQGGIKSFTWIWNGAQIAMQPNLQTFDEAKAELRATADACFSAWGTEYRKIVVSLSGGLDSSVLINLMRSVSDTEMIGLHYLGVDYERFEARYARMAAAHAGVDLVEVVQDPAKDQVHRILDAPRLARPKQQSLSVLIDDLSSQVANDVGADSFMIGQGGDNLFLQRANANHMLTDNLRLNGLSQTFWHIAYSAATLRQDSIWSTLSEAAAAALLSRPWQPLEFLDQPERIKHRPLTFDSINAIPARYRTHPWHDTCARLPRGKAEHLVSIIGLYNYYMHHGRGIMRDVSYPFFSQPIAEFALRAPTYLLCRDGLDRSLQRRAFSDVIPVPIARRTAKGGADHYSLQVMRQNATFFRDLILGGTLVNQGWFDRAAIERMLSPTYPVHGRGKKFVKLAAAAEAWLATWRDATVHRHAA